LRAAAERVIVVRRTNMVLRHSLLVSCLASLGCAHQPARTADPPSRSEHVWKCSRAVVSASTAVSCAEEFIKANGYTQAPALSPDKLTSESLERGGGSETWARDRHDTLQPSAYGYVHDEGGWTVMFCFEAPDEEAGRAVTMHADGSGMRVEHKDARLADAEVRLRLCEK
jgi:hypothetical protein